MKARHNRGTKSCCYGHPKFQRGDYNRCMMMSCSKNNQHTTPAALFPSARVTNNTVTSNRTSSCTSSPIAAEGSFSTSSSSFEDVMGSMPCLRTDDPIHIARLSNSTYQQDYNSLASPSFSSSRARSMFMDSGPMIVFSGARRNHYFLNENPSLELKLAYEEAKRLFQQHQHERRKQQQHALEAFFSLRRAGTTSGMGTQHFNSDHDEQDESRILREALLVLERYRTLSGPGAPPPGLSFLKFLTTCS